MKKTAEHNPNQNASQASQRLRKDVAVVALVSMAAFVFLSLHTSAAGLVGVHLARWMRWLLGVAADSVGIALVIGAVFIGKEGAIARTVPKVIAMILVFFALLIGIHLATAPILGVSSSAVHDWWYFGQTPGTGVLGALLTYWSLRFFGSGGVRLMLASMGILSFLLFFNLTLAKLILGPWHLVTGGSSDKESALPKLEKARQPRRKRERAEQSKPRWSFNLFRKKPSGTNEHQPVPEPTVALGSTEPVNQVRQETEILSPRSQSDMTPPRAGKPNRESLEPAGKSRDEKKPAVRQPEATEDKVVQFPLLQSAKSSKLPSIDLLHHPGRRRSATAVNQSALLEQTLESFGVDAKVVSVSNGPVITRYEVQPGPGTKVSKITNLADDLTLALAAESVRIEAPVPGKPVVGIEVPNSQSQTVYVREVFESKSFINHPSKLAMALGKDISGEPVIADLKKILHLLIAGATGAGKSVCLNTIINSFLFRATPDEVKLLMIDPKRVELVNYNGIPHLVSPVVTDPKKAATALRWAVAEMERRYQLFAEAGVRNIDGYNKTAEDGSDNGEGPEPLPYIVVIVDELADLMLVAANDVEDSICRLAQMARAAGMFLIIATQRPSVDVITGLIKANIPSRIAFAVSSQVDSRTILDMSGAERLLGKGDMLFYPIGASKAVRAQGAWIFDKDVEALVSFWRDQAYEVESVDIAEQAAAATEEAPAEDELFEDAVQLVIDTGQASISMLQRRFRIGYSRAARLIDVMELQGIVGPHQGSKPREVLVDSYTPSGSNPSNESPEPGDAEDESADSSGC